MELAPDDGLADFPQWLADGLLREAERASAFLAIEGGDPAAFEGLAPDRMAKAMRAQQAFRSLLEAILRASRADGPDPVGAWRVLQTVIDSDEGSHYIALVPVDSPI